MKTRLALGLAVSFAFAAFAARAENEIGFIEKFALAPDREAVLDQLVPGTEDYYFFRALQYQNTRQAGKLTALLEQWAKRFPDSQRRAIIENRAALLSYEADPQATLKFLRDRLNLEFNHEQQARDQKPDLPTKLDPALISRAAFQRAALENEDNVSQVNDEALAELVRDRVPLSESQRRDLLKRIKRPDVPFLLDLIEADLKSKESSGFGEFEIHRALLPEQLDELAKRLPNLYGNQHFVYARMHKLAPGADADAEFDPAEREAWLDRLWAYAKKLNGSYNSLKAQILLQRLQLDRTRGVYDKARFQEYLKLPRRSAYANIELLRRAELASQAADLNVDLHEVLNELPVIRSDEELVRDYLLHLLKDEPTWEPWAAWLRDTWLKPVFAEAKIVNGVGDPEKWASLLTPSAFQALKERVDVDFSLANPPFTAVADDVNIDLFLKNTPKLIVKIYEINTLSFFLTNQRQLNTDLALDGLVANREVTHDFSTDEAGRNPFRRTTRTFKFPELKGQRGAWVIEFIGGGKSSRALVRKGQWSLQQRTGAAGDMITVLDEIRQPVKDAVVWLDGRKYAPDEKTGYILVPFAQQPGPSPIILADAAGTSATLTEFVHHGEQYRLDAQFHIEREQLLARREATLAVRAALLLGEAQVSPELLQEPRLTLTSTTLDGVLTTSEIKDVKLDPAKLFTYRLAVPERLASLRVTLSGKVENLSAGGTKQELSASREFHLNGIDKTPATNDGRFTQFADRCVFELLGKNGEPVPDTAIVFHVTHQDFQKQLVFSLSTDARGRVDLGKLKDIARIDAETPFDRHASFYSARYRAGEQSIQVPSGEPIRVPWMGDVPFRAGDVSLLELRAYTYVKDHTAAVALVNGFLEIKSLPPGDYSLFCRGNGLAATEIHVVAGTVLRGWLNGATRQFEIPKAPPVHITAVKLDPDAVVVHVANVNPYVRVHVAATRFVPHGNLFESLGSFTRFEGASASPARRPNLFAAGRAIGDEYRYILERRYAKLFPGNMLPRPGLLLNPWEVRSTDLSAQSLAASEAPSRRAGDREEQARKPRMLAEPPPPPGGTGTGPDLDFLGDSSVALYNLVPDADGVVRVDRKALGDHPFIQVYAEDLGSAELRSEQYPETPLKLNDRRLVRNLDPQKPFAEKKEATVLTTGQTLTLADVLTADLETYDSLAGVFSLLTTLHGDPNLAKFAWVIQWPKLSDEEKRAKYSEFACHELNFFLARKDAAFFQKVVQPYLRNKRDRTFMDDFLVGNDLRPYLEPWAFARLNAAERCLLAQHLPGENAAVARLQRELWELLPPNLDHEDQLFETALRGRALTAGAGGDLEAEKVRQTVALRTDTNPAEKPAVGAAMAPASAPAPMPATVMNGVTTYSGTASLAAARAADGPAPKRDGLLDSVDESRSSGAGGIAGKDTLMRKKLVKAEGEYDMLGLGDIPELKRQRAAVRQFFRALGPTKEWAENNYYQLPLVQQGAELITINAFWRDYAAWDGKTPFVSANLPEAAHSFPEMMLALAVLDLPFESPKHTTRVDNGQFTLTAAGPLIAFHKEIKPAVPAPEQAPLLVSQSFFRADDRYREEGNEKFDKYVTDEFLAGVVYGANVVVTNPTSARQKVSVLLQIPRGALPVNGSKATDSRRLALEPYSTQTQEYYFYFPAPAAQPLPHYPVHVAREEQIVGEAKPFTFKVVPQLTQVDKTSWDYVSQYAKDAEVFAFLDQANIERLDLERIAWRARKSADFFRKLVAEMEKRHVYSEPIYRYALRHNVAAPLATWLRQRTDFLAQCGPYLDSKLLKIDPIERRSYEHLEYSPLVNQRAHRVGAENRIPNPVLRGQYQHLLDILAHKATLDAADQMSVVYYLFLQDRVEEALARFHTIAPEALPTRLQHDYFRCYAAFYEEQPAVARGLAQQYADYPVDRWRKLFAEVGAQLDEIEGKPAVRPGDDQPNREKQQGDLAATEPSFDFKVESRQIALTWKNLRDVSIRYYLMDPEFLFSASPFVTQDSGRFSIIKPTRTDVQALPEGKDQLSIPLPAEFTKANVLVEILGAGQRKAQTYHANTLKLTLAESYGRLETRDDVQNKPVSKAYVKVYARLHNGTVRFFKDGYTDLRGRFDYASLNSSDSAGEGAPMPRGGTASGAGMNYQMLSPAELGQVERFAILLMSESHGADVREAAPPAQ
ncbi:MAG: hypothetical protein ABJF10_16835 [Chthoniobacter sp.]|uniref:hypothetical protein n=1 Tax=Chthoniobacter sp. TaxID=2510640 RepID=UPI0032A86CDE